MFDGKTMNGWRTYKNAKGSWKVLDGILCSSSADEGNADLITDGVYKNFELSIDWKLSPEGNSGIMYLVTEDYEDAFLSGPEYQLIDDEGFPEKIEDWQKTGANLCENLHYSWYAYISACTAYRLKQTLSP